MQGLLTIALAYPTIVFTTLLAVAVLYWLFVILGAVHLDTAGAEHALGGDAVGAEGAHAGGGEGHADAGDAGDGGDGSHADADADVEGGPIDIVGALKLRSVPLMVTVSFSSLFSWLLSWAAMDLLARVNFTGPVGGTLALVGSFLLSLPLTALAIRPLAPLFKPNAAGKRRDLVGKLCVVRTGTVDHKFGEATLEDGGAGLVLRVRVAPGEELKRGEEAVIVAWDEEKDAFVVAPMAQSERPSTRAGRS